MFSLSHCTAITYCKALIQKINADDCQGLASEMAYNLILSLIPAIAFIFSLFGLIGNQETVYPMIIDFIHTIAPTQATDIFTFLIDKTIQGSSTGLTLLGFLITLWSASGSGGTVIKGLQRAYGLSQNKFPLWYSPGISVVMLLSLGIILLASFYLIVFGDKMIHWLSTSFSLPWNTVIGLVLLKWLIISVSIILSSAYIYALLLRAKLNRLSLAMALPGAIFFFVSWISVSLLFGLYINKMHQFNPVYGTIGALIILITWLYYSSFVFFIGGEITAINISKKSF